jgi:hypothetical protein
MIGVIDTSALIRIFVPDGPLPDGFEDFLRGVERGLNIVKRPCEGFYLHPDSSSIIYTPAPQSGWC